MDELKQKTSADKRNDALSRFFVVLCALTYVASYLSRKSFDSNITNIIDFYGVTETDVGLIGTFFFVAYAIGQVVHGVLCKRYNAMYSVFIVAIIGCASNLLFGIMPQSGFKYMKYVWCVNGFSQALLWSTFILSFDRLLAMRYRKFAITVMMLPVSVGTFITYGMSSLCTYLNNYKITFYVASTVMAVVGILWLCVYLPLSKACVAAKNAYDGSDVGLPVQTDKKGGKGKTSTAFISVFAVLALLAIINNFVKDGVTTWAPKILQDKYGLQSWLSILLTLALPMFAVFGSMLSLLINNKTHNFVLSAGILYIFALLFFGVLTIFLQTEIWQVALVVFMLVSCAMSGINAILTSVFPMECDEGVNKGLVAGLIDGFCYVGSAIASYGLGGVAMGAGWDAVIYLLLAVCASAVVISMVFFFIKQGRKKRTISK